MNKIAMSLGLRFLGSILDGKKVYIAGGALMVLGSGQILYGLAGLIAGMWPDIQIPVQLSPDESYAKIQDGAKTFSEGLAVFGGRHAIAKMAESGNKTDVTETTFGNTPYIHSSAQGDK